MHGGQVTGHGRTVCWRREILLIGKRCQRLSQDHVTYDNRLKLNNHLTSSCLWQTAAGRHAVEAWKPPLAVTGLNDLCYRPTRRRVLRCAGSSYFSLLVCATDSDSRSANASIASSNKRVLRFLIAAAFSLCQVVNVY